MVNVEIKLKSQADSGFLEFLRLCGKHTYSFDSQE